MSDYQILKSILNMYTEEEFNEKKITNISFLKNRIIVYGEKMNTQIPHRVLEGFKEVKKVD